MSDQSHGATHASTKPNSTYTRRGFLASAASATAAFSIVKPSQVRGSEANSRIEVGIIGCGGRGQGIVGSSFADHKQFKVVATADYFQDRAEAAGEKFAVAKNRRYSTLSCHEKMLADGVDAVAIISPPYFHPQQAQAAINAGTAVWVAKPVAVDAPGARAIGAAGQRGRERGVPMIVDFQTRANQYYKGAVQRIHNGAIGEFAFGEASYHASAISPRTEPDGSPEARLKNWVFDKALSGDIITEQNIHTLDVMSWIMNQAPLRAFGTGGRKVRTNVGDCWDHFVLTYDYPNDVGISFSSRQFPAHGLRPRGIRNRMFGTKGAMRAKYGGQVLIKGENFYRGGKTGQIYRTGVRNNMDRFAEMIQKGDAANETVEPSVRSTLVTVLGRTAAYEGRMVTWDEVVNSQARMEPDLSGLKA
jgi:predicted dehydrogenase